MSQVKNSKINTNIGTAEIEREATAAPLQALEGGNKYKLTNN